MKDFLATLLNVAVLVFAASSMLSVGFAYKAMEVLGPFRNVYGVIRSLVANFVLVPILALLITQALPLAQPIQTGLMLIAMAAGAPFLIKLTEHAEHDVGFSATVLLLLVTVTVLYIPLVMPLALPGARISPGAIARPLLLAMLLPLGFGLGVSEFFPLWAERLQPAMSRISSIALAVLVGATCLTHFRGILNLFGTGAILATLLLIVGAFLIGYALGGRNLERRGVLGLATGQRNIAAATVVATQGFADPGILVMVVTASLVDLAVLFPIARILRRRLARHTAAETGTELGNET
jgi:BASS family bile acid:Na+ symporter